MKKIIILMGLLSMFLLLSGQTNLNLKELKEKAAKIHHAVLTIDTHCDTPMRLVRGGFEVEKYHTPGEKGSGKIDLPRMKQGGLDAEFFAVFIGQGERTPEGFAKARNYTEEIFKAIHKMCNDFSDVIELATAPDDAYRLERMGKLACFIGIENGYPIGKDLSYIQKYYDLGARYITLCHTRNNDICDSSTDRNGPEHHGLSDFGREVVKEMNRLGMIVDVSHISDEAFYDVLEVSKAPVIASHSCARAICDNPRNLTDDMIKKLAEKGGVIQMCFLSAYVKAPDPNPERDRALEKLKEKYGDWSEVKSDSIRQLMREEYYEIRRKFPDKKATVSDLVDHIDHVVNLVGIDYVGIGTDFDGGGGLDGCNDVSEMGNVTLELVKRGYSEEDIGKIWGGNFMRVFREVIAIAENLNQQSH